MKYIIEERSTKWVSINVPLDPAYADMLNRPDEEIFDTRHAAKHAAHERNQNNDNRPPKIQKK